MRLNRLDLTRYGKFTDHAIEFPHPDGHAPDLHLIYGPNEAGKSTLFNAWLDLLFGIAAQNSYNFLHPYPTMQIGAAVEAEGDEEEFIRIKRQQNSLLNSSGQPVSETALAAALGGLDRDSYRTMFSLDDDTLEKGGESILESRGDLGELLFSASAGLGDLSRDLTQIRTDTEAFYKYRARSGELANLKTELATLKTRSDELDTQASEHARLVAAYEDATGRHSEASDRRRRVQTDLKAIDAMLAALPRARERADLAAQLDQMENVPDVRAGIADEITRLRAEEARLEAAGEALEQQISGLDQELSAIAVDEAILSMRDRFSDLERLNARHATAQEDVPKLKLSLGEFDTEITQLLIRLGRHGGTDAEALLLDAATSAALSEMIARRSEIDVRLLTARKELSDARTRHEEAVASLPQIAGTQGDPASGSRQDRLAILTAVLAQTRQEDHGHRLKAVQRSLGPARERLATLTATLAPWRGDMAALQAMTKPSAEDIEARKSALEKEGRDRNRLDEEIARLTREFNRLAAEREAITRTGDLPPPDTIRALRALRAARDDAWTDHRASLDEVSAETFKSALDAHDTAMDRQAAFHADAARLRDIAVQTATLEADLGAAIDSRKTFEANSRSATEKWRGSIAAMAPELAASEEDLAPARLEAWLHRRREALACHEQLRGLEHEDEAARQERDASRDRLARALAGLDETTGAADDLETLVMRAETVIARENATRGLRETEAAARREVARRETDLRNAEEDAQAWQTAWKSACAGCWLGQGERVPSADQVRQMLPLLTELAGALKQRAGLRDRVAKMQRDQADYEAAVAELAGDAGEDEAGRNPTELARRLSARLAAAEAARDQVRDLEERREKAVERQRADGEALAAHNRLKSELLDSLKAVDLADAARKAATAQERHALGQRIEALDRQLCESLATTSVDEALERLQVADRHELEQQRQDAEAELERLDTEVQDLYATRSRAGEALDAIGGDDAVALIEQQRRTVLETITEGAIRYMRLSAGVLAMEQALALYREHHRSGMMARASEAIRTISRGHYTGLTSQPDRDRELLIALTRDGGSKQAGEMSKGARFQLYLALRVAGYHEFAQSRQTVPFIADDIMETFDDFRAEETFRLFAGMAGVGQVIYLTHHRHLCDIARSVCPTVHIHDLTG
ncbi:MAG: AAA family ATPase [Roseitalea porphyridii]|uniref:ATP-binding protein n=1 Tax=Roseitalea porphyridii TaxID=1852022 RepID=UPI0032EB094D